MKNFLLVVIMTFFIAFEGCSKNDSNNENTGEQQAAALENNMGEKKAPDFKLPDTNGKQVKLSDYKNKIVIIDFWATWCPPCRKGIPDLISIQKEYPNDVVVLGISLDTETKGDVVPFMKNIGINYPVVYGDMAITQKYGGVEAIPTSFIIDKNGNIVDKHVGLVPKSVYTDLIKKLLSKS